jgi:FdhE protein
MTKVGASAPIPIGDIANPPFARVPNPEMLFARRAARLQELANSHDLKAYLQFLAQLSNAQHRAQAGLPPVDPPAGDVVARAREFGMPPLDRNRFTVDPALEATLNRLPPLLSAIDMPEAARHALDRVQSADATAREAMVRSVLADAIPMEMLAEHVFVAAALQVHFARLAASLDARDLVPVGDGVCPACGGPPVTSLIVGWDGAHGARFCCCSLCATLWNYVRIKCTLCASTEGIGYLAIDGSPGTVKAETCESCHGYVKILHQHVDPALDPVADDVASLALDLLVRKDGYRRGAVNPFLLGY